MPVSKGKAKLVDRLRNPRFRPREAQFLVEGARGVREVLHGALKLEVRFALVSPRLAGIPGGADLRDLLDESQVPMEEISDLEMEALSATEQPQGVLMVVREPESPFSVVEADNGLRLLILDGVQDPGNAGTLVRAAWAFGLSGVCALEGTVDPFNPKVVRAAAGALANVPVLRFSWPELRGWLDERKVTLLVADSGGEDVRTVEASAPWALVVGNEGGGCREEIVSHSARVLAIPMRPGVDSLNAGLAGAILLFALTPSSRKDLES